MTTNKTKERSRGLSFAILLGLLVAGFMIGSSAEAAEFCGPVRADTFTIKIGAASDVVRVGGTAALSVEVRRSAAGQDLGPAEHADVLAVITVGDRSWGVAGVTDHDGVAKLQLQLPRKLRPGLADVAAIATSYPAHCVEEFGEGEVKGLFKVVR